MKEMHTSYNSNLASTKLNYFLGVIFTGCIVLLLESYATYLYFLGEISITSLIVIHIVICLLLSIVCGLMYFFKSDVRLYLYLLFMTSVAAIIGAGISLLTSIMCWVSYKNIDPDWLYKIGLEDEEGENERLYDRLISSQEDFTEKGDIVPISEVLEEGSTSEQRLIIAKMARYFSPRFSKLLRQAVKSKENSIRVQAATVIANIESTFSKKLIELEKLYSEDEKSPDTAYKLAQHCDTYAYCGILTDAEKVEHFYLRAIGYYKLYQKLSGDNSEEISLALARLNIRVNNNKEALKYLDIIIKGKNGLLTPQLFLWYVEVLYCLRKYSEINQFCQSYQNNVKGDAATEEMAKATMDLWMHTSEA
ncbi:hypothetical protein OAO18_05825 [Francisellaceae bacterium]|nr:hypothetical protein [Francisellaceae bacterium]